MTSNPYESPQNVTDLDRPFRIWAWVFVPSFSEWVLVFMLATVSMLIHFLHGKIFDWLLRIPGLGGGTVFVLVGSSTLTACLACGIIVFFNRSGNVLSFAAFVLGVGTTAVVSVATCWLLMLLRQGPSGAVVFIGALAGLSVTKMLLGLPLHVRKKPSATSSS